MSDSNVSALPKNLALDLDSESRPENEVKPEFTVQINGREITMTDPSELDWRDLILLESPTEFLRLSLTAEDRKFLLEQPLPGWKFNRLMEAYYNHFDLDQKVRDARRQQALAGV
jgi:hypothetical protein